MNWKEEAADKLRRYDAMRLAVTNIPEELERLEQEAGSLRGADPSKTRIISSKCQDSILINNLVRRGELASNFNQAQSWLRTTNRALEALTPEERLVLHRLYICPERGALERLCCELGVEQSSIYRKRDKALHRFTMALYGVDS